MRRFKGAVSIFHSYGSAHNKLESVWPKFSSLESKIAPSKEGEHGGKFHNSRQKKHQDDESERKSFSNKTPAKAFTPPAEKKKGHKVVFRQKSKRVTGLYNT